MGTGFLKFTYIYGCNHLITKEDIPYDGTQEGSDCIHNEYSKHYSLMNCPICDFDEIQYLAEMQVKNICFLLLMIILNSVQAQKIFKHSLT